MFSLQFFVLAVCATSIHSQMKPVEVPPKGWNSYDSFLGNVDESAYLGNCQNMKAKLGKAYEYCVIDYYWYINFTGGPTWIDEWGRPIPAADKWPSSASSKGFKAVADKVHAMGLKFGFHVMRGISESAVKANTPIKGTNYHAKDAALTTEACPWSKTWYAVNTSSPAGQAFYASLVEQYAEWDTDFIKNDCVFGSDFLPNDIKTYSEHFQKSGRQFVYSLSPGSTSRGSNGAERGEAEQINHYVNMYRVTDDDWDSWGGGHLEAHFRVGEVMGNLSGTAGLNGKSFTDMDMLPFGNLSAHHSPERRLWGNDASQPKVPEGHKYDFRPTQLTKPEQQTQMTMWAMVNSPFFMGGDLRHVDDWTVNLLTNSDIMEIDNTCKNRRTLNVGGPNSTTVGWVCDGEQHKYVAFFNKANWPVELVIDAQKIFGSKGCNLWDVWGGSHCGEGSCARYTDRHGVLLVRVEGC